MTRIHWNSSPFYFVICLNLSSIFVHYFPLELSKANQIIFKHQLLLSINFESSFDSYNIFVPDVVSILNSLNTEYFILDSCFCSSEKTCTQELVSDKTTSESFQNFCSTRHLPPLHFIALSLFSYTSHFHEFQIMPCVFLPSIQWLLFCFQIIFLCVAVASALAGYIGGYDGGDYGGGHGGGSSHVSANLISYGGHGGGYDEGHDSYVSIRLKCTWFGIMQVKCFGHGNLSFSKRVCLSFFRILCDFSWNWWSNLILVTLGFGHDDY